MVDRGMEIALFRYALIREAADPRVSKADRGRMVRLLAEGVHTGPGGVEVRVGRSTLDQWIRAWRAGGFEALKPKPRALPAKVPAAMLDLAEALKRENPQRTAAHVARDLGGHARVGPERADHPTPFPAGRHDPAVVEHGEGGVRAVRSDGHERVVGR